MQLKKLLPEVEELTLPEYENSVNPRPRGLEGNLLAAFLNRNETQDMTSRSLRDFRNVVPSAASVAQGLRAPVNEATRAGDDSGDRVRRSLAGSSSLPRQQ